jgi:O-antigen/teichoic acid export membrane protein
MDENNLKEKTAKGLFWGGVSNSAQQALGVVFGIILLNKLTPGDYGMIGMLSIFLALANTIQDSGFTVALTNRPSFDHRDYNAVFWFNLMAGSFFYILLFFCAPLIADFFHQPELTPLARVLFLSIVTGSFGIAHNAVLFREMMVKERAKIDIFSLLISGIVGVILALYGCGYWALAIQTLLFSATGTIFRWIFSPWRPTFSFDFKPIKEMFGFSSRMLLSTIIAQVQGNIFSILLGRYYAKADVGYYGQGNKWAGMGGQVVNGMLTSVSQPLFNNVKSDKERLTHVFRKVLRFVSFVASPILLGIAFVGNEFINIVNPQFAPCVPILQIYCVITLIGCFTVPYTQLCVSMEKSNYYLKASLFYSIVQIIAALLSVHGGMYVLALVSLGVSIAYAFVWHFIAYKLIRLSLMAVLKDLSPYVCITVLSIIIAHYVSSFYSIDNIWQIIIIKIITVAMLYWIAVHTMGSKIYEEFIEFVRKRK